VAGVTFYFDFNSPYAYLAAERIGDLIPDAEWRPIAFAIGVACLLLGLVISWILVVVGFTTASFDLDPDTIDEYRMQDIVHVVGCALLVAAAVLLVNVVRAITRRQTARQTLEGQPA